MAISNLKRMLTIELLQLSGRTMHYALNFLHYSITLSKKLRLSILFENNIIIGFELRIYSILKVIHI